MAEERVHKMPLTAVSSGEEESESESKECRVSRPPPSMAHSPNSPASSTSAASTEGMPEPEWEGEVRFKDMPLSEKYEGKYKFMNVDQADYEISLLMGRVEGLKAVIKKYDNVLEVTFTKYRDAMCRCKNLSEEFEKIARYKKKLEKEVAEYKERMGKFEVRLKCAQEARQEAVCGKSHGKPLDEVAPSSRASRATLEVRTGASVCPEVRWTMKWS